MLETTGNRYVEFDTHNATHVFDYTDHSYITKEEYQRRDDEDMISKINQEKNSTNAQIYHVVVNGFDASHEVAAALHGERLTFDEGVTCGNWDIHIYPAIEFKGAIADLVVNQSYFGFIPSVEGGRGQPKFVLDEASILPLGLVVDPYTGQVSGRPYLDQSLSPSININAMDENNVKIQMPSLRFSVKFPLQVRNIAIILDHI